MSSVICFKIKRANSGRDRITHTLWIKPVNALSIIFRNEISLYSKIFCAHFNFGSDSMALLSLP